MNYDFLRNYSIPTRNSPNLYYNSNNVSGQPRAQVSRPQSGYASSLQLLPPPPPPPSISSLLDYGNEQYPITAQPQEGQYQQPNRFMPPNKCGNNYRPPPSRPLKRKYNSTPSSTTKELAETTADGKIIIFQGRDESYPDELNRLIHSLNCELCSITMNSLRSAKDHYESKQHDRQISSWIVRNYDEKGLKAPEVKRFFKGGGPIGPEAFHCELCDLKLTSQTHANQHYAGRKHRLVVGKVSKPSGVGFYNAEGKWVRTATKLSSDGRFGVGDKFAQTAQTNKNDNQDIASSDADTTTSADGKPKLDAPSATPDQLHCAVCSVQVTSAAQMQLHLDGAKHRKKLKASAEGMATQVATPSTGAENDPSKTILASLNESSAGDQNDLSMYRTPTGFYYCSVCNVTMCHVTALQQHLIGKKHIKKATDEKAKTNTKVQPKK